MTVFAGFYEVADLGRGASFSVGFLRISMVMMAAMIAIL
jgi:hypothetical protein